MVGQHIAQRVAAGVLHHKGVALVAARHELQGALVLWRGQEARQVHIHLSRVEHLEDGGALQLGRRSVHVSLLNHLLVLIAVGVLPPPRARVPVLLAELDGHLLPRERVQGGEHHAKVPRSGLAALLLRQRWGVPRRVSRGGRRAARVGKGHALAANSLQVVQGRVQQAQVCEALKKGRVRGVRGGLRPSTSATLSRHCVAYFSRKDNKIRVERGEGRGEGPATRRGGGWPAPAPPGAGGHHWQTGSWPPGPPGSGACRPR